MHLLGHHLPDHKLLKVALTSFYGISHATSSLLLFRLSIPLTSRVSDLTETQITALSAFLSSPSTSPRPGATPLSTPSLGAGAGAGAGTAEAGPSRVDTATGTADTDAGAGARRADPLENLKIETDLRRSMQADIAHQRQVGTYRGRR
ncbi:hypothetical protein EHS25_002554 [Saitozyma podzolica]|uniref:Uncharacterized protein n=1 Tax=Saitozyma podzolica TaxID=1890683 RepID=A0A427YCU9_9TREE|nr:hypothetical protein EHS25_002554 [Saitozyma podzolica]